MIGKTGNRPRTSTHHISHGAESPHPAATIHSSTAAARLAAGTVDASPITSPPAPSAGPSARQGSVPSGQPVSMFDLNSNCRLSGRIAEELGPLLGRSDRRPG
jgi:hypothetical protein